ncbi:MAG: hypothetical protein ACP5O7_12575 [Phycisphaerae bacterium]
MRHGVIFLAGLLPLLLASATPGAVLRGVHADGYMIVPTDRVPKKYDAGFSIYTAVWPLLLRYPGHQFQSGLFGTWMAAQYASKRPLHLYSDIEGGLGWWRGTRFPTAAPKFHMGGVAYNFHAIADTPGNGSGSWKHPRGLYGIAQLSPWLLFPPDGLTLKPGVDGQLFGYGYLPLPLTDPQSTTDGKNIPMGNHCWTLFLNTQNFKGPVSFFTPYFWHHQAVRYPQLIGKLLDSRWSNSSKPFAMETQYLPAAISLTGGHTYARLGQVSFPVDAHGNTIVLSQSVCYSRQALWDFVKAWFNGGPPVSGRLSLKHGFVEHFRPKLWSTWQLFAHSTPKPQRVHLPWELFAQAFLPNLASYGFTWSKQLVHNGPDGFRAVLPRYYRLMHHGKKTSWQPVARTDVPDATGLKHINFYPPRKQPPKPYTTPDGRNSPFKNPGPAAGPFYARLSDHSVVTYYWYRFEDQPALLNADLSKAERDKMQKRFDLLERHWTKNRQYLPPPTHGALVYLDPAQIVTPPKRLAIGYVPIVTRQQWDGKHAKGQ